MGQRRNTLAMLGVMVLIWLFLGSRDLWSSIPGIILHLPFAGALAFVAAGLWLPPAGKFVNRLGRSVVLLPVALLFAAALLRSSWWLSGYCAESALESFLTSASKGERPNQFLIELESKGRRAVPDFYEHITGSHQINFRDRLFYIYEFGVRFEKGESFYFSIRRANILGRWQIYVARSDQQ